MMKKRSILFVCDYNVFRSLSAEYSFKKYLEENKIFGWKVGSAGIRAKKQEIPSKVKEELEKINIDVSNHKPRKLSKEILEKYDVVVAMSSNHKEFIKKKLGNKNVLLFNELAINKEKPILDVEEEIKNYKSNINAVERKISKTVKHIFKKTPKLFKNISERFYLFSDFAEGKIPHRNNFPFIRLYETKNTLAFMSIDIPEKEDGHILVIPKERYADFSDIPKKIVTELMYSIQKIGEGVKKTHQGYNILLNNGVDAGQYIYHVHFHVIPRKAKDGIIMEGWKKKNMTKRDFVKINKKLKKHINS